MSNKNRKLVVLGVKKRERKKSSDEPGEISSRRTSSGVTGLCNDS